MDVIFTILLQTWIWKQFFPAPYNIIGYHNENVYYTVVRNFPVLLYLTWSQINVQQTHVKQYVFMFTAMFNILMS